LRQLQSLARRQPVLMIFEDLHWIDPTSREVLDLFVERIASLPILMSRPTDRSSNRPGRANPR
jgi:predicted ATPase